ncbi:hypothetical protein D3C74_314200 [compost metagenome]
MNVMIPFTSVTLVPIVTPLLSFKVKVAPCSLTLWSSLSTFVISSEPRTPEPVPEPAVDLILIENGLSIVPFETPSPEKSTLFVTFSSSVDTAISDEYSRT